MSYLSKRMTRLLTWLVIVLQFTTVMGVGAVTAIQPTPQMAQEAAQQAGFGDWFANAAGDLTAAGQRLWGAPAAAQAAATFTWTPVVPVTYTTSIDSGNTTADGVLGTISNGVGLCVTQIQCRNLNATNLVDSDLSNFNTMRITAALLNTGVKSTVDLGQTFSAGTRVGFLIDPGAGLFDIGLVTGFRIKTFNAAGTLLETRTFSSLFDLSIFGSGSQRIVGFKTTQDFRRASLEYYTLIAALGQDLAVYYPVIGTISLSTSPGGVATNLAHWAKADVGTYTDYTATTAATPGDLVASWTDQSGNGINLIASANGGASSSDAKRPTLANSAEFNYNPALSFTGNKGMGFNNAVIANNSDGTMFTVAKWNSRPAAYQVVYGFGPIANDPGIHIYDDTTYRFWDDFSISANQDHATAVATGQMYLLGADWDNGVSNDLQISLNGNRQTTTGEILSTNTERDDRVCIGNDCFAGEPLDGEIAEVLTYDRRLTVGEQQQVNSYLSIKYGLTLAATDYVASNGSVTIWSQTTNSGYNNNIAGIGRDDTSELNQKQSTSANNGFQPVIGLGSIAATNAANANSFAADKNFMLWGSTTGSASFDTTYAPTSFSPAAGYFRMARVWKVQETGTVGNVSVQGTGADHLLVSSDPTFASGVTEIDMSSGSATVNFSNGHYFTFGAELTAPGGVTTDLMFWFDPTSGVTKSGTDVTAWADKATTVGPNPNPAVNVATHPVYSDGDTASNYNPYITFSGARYLTADMGAGWGAAVGRQHTTFGVASRSTSQTSWNHFFRFSSAATVGGTHTFGIGTYVTDPTKTGIHYIDGAIGTEFPSSIANSSQPDVATIYGGRYSGTTLGTLYNGHYTNVTQNLSTDYHQHLQIGDDGLYGMDGKVQEIVMYKSGLSDPDALKVNSYLAIKYGVTLYQTPAQNYVATNSSVIWDATANSAYNNDIAGIGRDDAEGLNQKQSTSVNIDDIITMGIGPVTTTNVANTGVFTSNLSYLVWGNNNASATTTTALNVTTCAAPGQSDQRINRVWKVQETGALGKVYVQAALAAGFNANLGVYMMVSTDPTFATYTSVPMTKNGALYDTSYNFTSGDYFTFAGNTSAPANVCTDGNKYINWATAGWSYGVKSKTVTQGSQVFTFTVSDPGNVIYAPTWYPMQYGNKVYIPRYDNNPGSAIQFKMKMSKPALSVQFEVCDIDGWFGGKDVTTFTGFLNGLSVGNPQLSKGNDFWSNNYGLTVPSANSAQGSQYWWDCLNPGRVFVNFSQPVDEVRIDYTKNNQYSFMQFNDLLIGSFNVMCAAPPPPPTADNIYLSKRAPQGLNEINTPQTFAFEAENLSCNPQTVNITDTLPSGLTYVGDSLMTALTPTINVYSGTTSLNLTNLVLPSGKSTFNIDVMGTVSNTYHNQASLAVNGNTYLSDDPNQSGSSDVTPLLLQSSLPSAAITVTKSANVSTASQNTVITYTFQITNAESNPVTVQFHDLLDGQMTYLTGTLVNPNGGSVQTYGGQAILDVFTMTLPVGVSTVSVQANTNGTLTNTATVNVAEVTPMLSSGYLSRKTSSNAVSVLITNTVASQPDLTTTIGQPSPALVSGVASNLPVTVTNSGAGATTGSITTTVTLPTGVSAPASFSSNGNTCTTSGQTVTCVNLGPINNGSSNTIQVPVTPNNGTVGTQPVFNATTATPGDSNTGNNAATPLTASSAVVASGAPNLLIHKSSASSAVRAGDKLTYTISITNSGAVTATSVQVVDAIPAPLTYVKADQSITGATLGANSTITWTTASLAPNATRTLTLVTLVPGNTVSGTVINNSATISASNIISTITSNNASLSVISALPAIIPTMTCGSPVCLSGKVLLSGPYNTGAGLMVDTLRIKGLLPQTEPYTALGFSHGPGGGGERLDAAALSIAGNDAIVDWVFLQLRDGSDQVVATRSALLQRDGDIVDMDGTSNVGFDAPPGDYIVTVRHRNHLGVMTAGTVTFSAGSCASVDFTDAATDVYNTTSPDYSGNERVNSSGVLALWPGDANSDSQIVYNGVISDSGAIQSVVLSDPGNTLGALNYIAAGYQTTDINLDGDTKYAGTGNDLNYVINSVLSHPLNPSFDVTFVVQGQYTSPSGIASQSICATLVADLTTTIGQPSPALVAGVASNLPVTVTNSGAGATTGSITTTVTLPTGVSAPASFSSSGNTCTTSGQTVTCVNPGPINNGSSNTIQVPVTPNNGTVGTQPVFNATTATPGDSNTGNNAATPLTASSAVISSDTTPPVTTITAPITGTVTNDNTPTVSGAGEPGSTVTVTVGSQTMTTVVPVSGNWVVTPTSSIGSDGSYTPTVRAVDPAGNTYGPVSSNPFRLDTTVAAPIVTSPTAGSTISDTTPTLTGTAEPTSTVTVKDASGTTVCTTTANAAGNWSCTTSTLTAGSSPLGITATDAAGNTSSPTYLPFTLDTTPPVTPTVNTPANGSSTNDSTPIITGTAEAGSVVTVKEGVTTICTATANGSGLWSCAPSVAMSSAPHTLNVTTSDAAGNVSPSASTTFTVDTTAPALPTIITPTESLKSNDNTPLITGTAEVGSVVTVKEGATTLCTTTADGSGNWSCTSAALSDGTHTILAAATDAAGNTGSAAVRNFVIDTAAPVAPTITAPASGSSTNDSTPTVIGTAEPGSRVTVYDGLTPICTTTANANGDWSCTPTTPLSSGNHTLSAIATDGAGNSGPASTLVSVTVDTTAPATPTINVPSQGAVTSDNTPTFTGNAEAGSTVAVKEGSTILCTVVADSNGLWNCTPATSLSNGAHNVTATATDAAGNSATTTSRSFSISNINAVISAPVASALVSDTTPSIMGTGTPSATVTVYEGGTQLCTSMADALGNWSCTPAAALSQGGHTITATVNDSSGGSLVTAPVSFAIDSVAPTAPVISAPVAGATTADSTPTFTGTAQSGATVTVSDGGATLCSAVANGSGNWSCTPTTPMAHGVHTIQAAASDAAGNSSPTTSQPLTIDTQAPLPPTVNSPSAGTVVSDTTPTLTGSSEPSTTVKIVDGGVTLCTTTADASGNWSCTPTTPLSQGNHPLLVTATDPVGNVSTATAHPLVIDSSAPTAPTVLAPAAGSTTTDNTPTISGTAEPASTVTVKDENGNSVCTATTNGSGVWSCTPAFPLSDGSHTLAATATDPAGNSSTPAIVPFVIDSTAPLAAVINAPTEGAAVNDTTPTIAGTAEPSSTVKIYEGATLLCQTTATSGGSYSCNVSSALSQGLHSVTALATDVAGNSSPVSAPRTFTVDSLAPTVPTITAPTSGSTTSDDTPTVSGTAEAGSLITVKDENGSTLCTATTNGSGNWSCVSSTLTNGPHTLQVTASDAAGNSSTPAVRSFSVDTTAPTIQSPAASSLVTDTTPTFSGTGTPGAPVTVTVQPSGSVLCTATVSAGGNWSCTPTTALSQGSNTVQAQVGPLTTTPLTFNIDSVAPVAPVINTPTVSSTTGDSTPTISGSAEAGSTVVVKEGSAVLCTATADSAGVWSCEPSLPMASGLHTITATATDVAGNNSPASAGRSFTVDTNAPSAPTITTPISGGTTNDTTPTISGLAEAGATVTVQDGTTPVCTTTSNGSGQWSCTPSTPFNEGVHDLTATATDVTGNTSPASAPVQVTVDSVAPAAPTVTQPLTNTTTADTTPTIVGQAEAGSTVRVSDGPGGTLLCTAVADAGGNWSCTPAAPLSNGAHTLNVIATDSAGNASQPATRPIVVDSVAPSAPVVTQPVAGSSSNDSTPTFSGTGEPGATVTVSENGATLCTALVAANGSWSCDATTALSDGLHVPLVQQADAAGNSSLPVVRVFTIDTTAPETPVITLPITGTFTSDTTPLISGGAEPASSVSVMDNGTLLCTTIASPTGNWSCSPSAALLEGDHTFTAIATDSASNSSPTSEPVKITVDIIPTGDSDGDGIANSIECPGGANCPDTDKDGLPDYLDADSDNDGILDSVEGTTDSDGDGIPDRLEDNNADTDNDGVLNPNDADDDGDGTPTRFEDLNGDNNWSNDDKDGDGIPAYLDPNDSVAGIGDADNDGISDAVECPGGAPCPDTDGDGTPDYIDVDSDGDGIQDLVEGTSDSDGDGIPNRLESNTIDTDGDGLTNQNDADDDGDGIATTDEDLNHDGNWSNDDADGDGIPAYLDPNDAADLANGGDSDNDGFSDTLECAGGIPCPDTDGDGQPDYLDTDSDGDGVSDQTEGTTDSDGDGIPDRLESSKLDTDGDDLSNQNDPDDDGDGLSTRSECPNGVPCPDTDSDGIPDYLDPMNGAAGSNGGDSDGDGIADGVECPTGAPCTDTDGDGQPDYMDADSDGDGVSDQAEGTIDSDGDGIPNRLESNRADTDGDGLSNQNDADDDGDGIPTRSEDLNGDGNWSNDDKDGDGIPAYLDPNDAANLTNGGDSDSDGIDDATECVGGAPCPDTDGDGQPDYLDKDSDGDGVTDQVEGTTDSDSDGIPDRLEPNNVDTDGDGLSNQNDADDDGDEIPTNSECANGVPCPDTDGDRIPDYLDPVNGSAGSNGGDSDGDGISDGVECPTGVPCLDTDGDGQPDYLDADSDNDGVSDQVEGTTDSDGDGIPNRLEDNGADTDGDGLTNQNDADDDGDGIATADEDLNHDGNWSNDDVDGDGIPAYLDPNDASDLVNGGDSDGDGIKDAVECAGGVPCPDTDGDGQPDYLDKDSDGDGVTDQAEGTTDSDGDGIPNRLEPNNVDTDGDGLSNQNDPDDDGDGLSTISECASGVPCQDSDSDRIPDYLDPVNGAAGTQGGDSDGDGIPDAVECPTGAPCIDSDGDGQPNYLDSDDDGDGLPTLTECPNPTACQDGDGDSVPNYLEPSNVDLDGDGLPNQVDADDDGDGVGTKNENPGGGLTPTDTDGDGIPDYLDPVNGGAGNNGGDSDGDGISDAVECPTGAPCIDSDGDGVPNYADSDDDGDGIATVIECQNPASCSDIDSDTVPDYLEPNNQDIDNDGLSNQVDANDDGDAANTSGENPGGGLVPKDTDGDGIPDYLDPIDAGSGLNGGDSDGDGINDASECPNGVPCPDTDGDGLPNYIDPDDDGDGIATVDECANPTSCTDSDIDGVPDYLEPGDSDIDGDGVSNQNDPDDDGDGIKTADENPGGGLTPGDTDGDGIPDYLDPVNGGAGSNGGDSDGDGIKDAVECPNGAPCLDSDGDGMPNYADTDDDGDDVPTLSECPNPTPCSDSDGDTVPDYLESNKTDTDNDDLSNQNDPNDDGDAINTSGENPGGGLTPKDTDGDGIPDYLDPVNGAAGTQGGDSDGDGIKDAVECPGGVPCPDSDGDGQPDYLDTDSDNDGVSDQVEGTTDSDGDGTPDRVESNKIDTDGDGVPNQQDNDDDGDGIPTKTECANGVPCPDADRDGIPDYLDPVNGAAGTQGGDSDGDGIKDAVECPGGAPCPDTDGDGVPDYVDSDSDNDGISDQVEGTTDSDSDGIPDRLENNDADTDGDGVPNQQDNDDDGDGIPTKTECANGVPCPDTDKDGIADYLDPVNGTAGSQGGDSDGDGIPDAVECPGGVPCPDTDGDGVPNYADADDDGDGLPTKLECTNPTACLDSDGDTVPNYLEPSNTDLDGDDVPNQYDPDDDGDGINTSAENPGGGLKPKDTDGDGIPDYLDPVNGADGTQGGDSDGDGIKDAVECPTGAPCIDSDGDGVPNYLDSDDDGDGKPTAIECPDPAACVDSDGDTVPDYLESSVKDLDSDGLPDQTDPDDDGDGINTIAENPGGGLTPKDTDNDGIPDYLDPVNGEIGSNGGDSDGDGIKDRLECTLGIPCPDSDGDGIPNYLDTDDDGDAIPTATECPNPVACVDNDGDTVPNYLEANNKDLDGDGQMNHNDANDDGDATDTKDENPGGGLTPADTDGDGIPDYLDPVNGGTGSNGGDSDGDGIKDGIECPSGAPCRDSDGDGVPNYLDKDDDGDGILTAIECPNPVACVDSDDDTIPNYLEPDNQDLDGDGLSNQNDPDDDGDAILTRNEKPGAGVTPVDTDGDGIPDYLDPVQGDNGTNGGDSDGDGIKDAQECPSGEPCLDSDGDGKPNYLDTDDDGDGIPTVTECPNVTSCTDTDSDTVPDYLEPNNKDTDGDGKPNYQDADDDGDGINTSAENPGAGVKPSDSDLDSVPDYLEPNNQDLDDDGLMNINDPDDDGDQIPTRNESPGGGLNPIDTDGDGPPDYLDPIDNREGSGPPRIYLPVISR